MCNKAQNVTVVRRTRKFVAERSILLWENSIIYYKLSEWRIRTVPSSSFSFRNLERSEGTTKERKMDDNAYLLRRRGAFDDVPFAMSLCGLLRGYDGRPSRFIFVR